MSSRAAQPGWHWPALAAVCLALTAVAAQETTPTQVARPTESVPLTGCVTAECHPGIKARPVTHGPVGADACDACHQEVDAGQHEFELARSGAELCDFCHDLELDGAHVHQPVADGLCVECHDPHGGASRFLLRGETDVDICAECHDDVTGGLPVVHGPVAAGACTACHHGHSSDYPMLLKRAGRDLCLECHRSIKRNLESAATVHDPVAGDCTACHAPHAAEEQMLLADDTPALCLACHSEIEDLIDEATTRHSVVSTGAACANCHDAHGSGYAALLIDDMVELCLSCHDREIELEDGTLLRDMKTVLAAGPNLHGPIAQRNCAAACHQVHGSSNPRLLAQAYPQEFYAPFREESYALCFSCHDSQAVLYAHTDKWTGFRNGDRNLHYLHVNKEDKGRTCRTCHGIHASRNAKQIRDSVPFGSRGWRLPINFEKTGTGGRCSPGCHRPCGYDRAEPVDNSLP